MVVKEQREKLKAKRVTTLTRVMRLMSRGQGGMGRIIYKLCFVFGSLLIFMCSCASLHEKEKILAVVDGEPITEGDFKYAVTISHRREDLSSAGSLKLEPYVHKLIDDKLIIQEARKSGMDKLPEIQQAIDAYILRESVVRLHDEEIVKKVSVTEEELMDYYKKNYEEFTVGIIEMKSQEEINNILEMLKKGEEFDSLAKKYSQHPSRERGGQIKITKGAMSNSLKDAIPSLKIGEITDVIFENNRYYIVKLIDRREAPIREFTNVKESIRKSIRKQKENELSKAYLEELRKRSNIKIDQELLSSIDLSNKDKENYQNDDRVLVDVNGDILKVKDFVSMVKPTNKLSNEVVINNWIDRNLVDQEAISRHYEQKDELKNMIKRYEDQLLKNAFIKRIIVPQIVVTEDALKEYYLNNKNNFLKPTRYKIQQITVKTIEEANEIIDNLKNGADFSWMAKRYSLDSSADKGGDIGWVAKTQLPEEMRSIIDDLKISDASPPVKVNSSYRIIRLTDRIEGEVEDYTKAKDAVFSRYFDEQLDSFLKKYVEELKKDAKIKINEKEIRYLEEKFKK